MSDKPSRRQLASGAAWSLPVLAIGAAAPAMAASGCPSFTSTISADGNDASRDWVTITLSSGSNALPSGTTISWQVQNHAGGSRRIGYGVDPTTQVTGSVSPASLTLANNASGTVTFTTTAIWSPGQRFRFDFGTTNTTHVFRQRLTITRPNCPSYTACLSVNDNATPRYAANCPA